MQISFYNKIQDDYLSFDVNPEDNVGEILYEKEKLGYEIDSCMGISDKLDLYARLSDYKIDRINQSLIRLCDTLIELSSKLK